MTDTEQILTWIAVGAWVFVVLVFVVFFMGAGRNRRD